MKKSYLFITLVISLLLTGCEFVDIGNTGSEGPFMQLCGEPGEFVVVDGDCILINENITKSLKLETEETRETHFNSVEFMGGLTADLDNSKGLAVVSRSAYQMSNQVNMNSEETTDTDNIIVKLTDEGLLEQLSFEDDNGFEVNIQSNPLALEVYGPYTVVIFEVNFGEQHQSVDFNQKIYDSLYAGGVYLIHNESGKLFATKDVEYTENSWTEIEDHSRHIKVEVTLFEPVIEMYENYLFDQKGNPLLDDEGNYLFELIEKPVLDENGEPLIFTEGPILTELKEVPLVEYIKELKVDENGDPVLDENGEEVYIIFEEPILDDEGNQIIELQQVPVLDEEGNIKYQENFEVELFIEEIREVTYTEYYASILENPLSPLAQKFVDRIMNEYYNWNYLRVSDYSLDAYGFTYTDDNIFFIDHNKDRMLIKVSYDEEANELLLEDYLSLSKAGFDMCSILFDPTTNNVICNQWDQNIKIYNESNGLQTIEDTKNLNQITLPNGELYFHSYDETYVEDFGYYTTSLYRIKEDGTLESNYIELGEKEETCYDNCNLGVQVNVYNHNGESIESDSQLWLNLTASDGDKIINSADLTRIALGSFSSDREPCTEANGCWYQLNYELSSTTGTYKFESHQQIYPGDEVPNFLEKYDAGDSLVYEFVKEYTSTPKVCENEIGCQNSFGLVDKSMNQYGLWIWTNDIIEQGEILINHLEIKSSNEAVYEYAKVIEGEVCQSAACSNNVSVLIYDLNDNLLSDGYMNVEVQENEVMPISLEYHITENTSVTMSEEVCSSSTGCSSTHNTFDGYQFTVFYDEGDEMYQDITFEVTDKLILNSQLVESEVCSNVDGCFIEDVQYIIVDANDDPLYEFSQGVHIEYGYTCPFKVTVNISDIEVHTQNEHSNEDKFCNESECNQQVQFIMDNGESTEYVGSATIKQNLGEKLITSITFPQSAYVSGNQSVFCTNTEGCIHYTDEYYIFDEEGNEYTQPSDGSHIPWLPVKFEYGDYIPNSNSFAATFTIKNMTYNKTRMSTWEFIHNMQNVTFLSDDMYLIENTDNQNNSNFILNFDPDTDRYKVSYTNISSVHEISQLGDSFIAINGTKTDIIEFTLNEELSSSSYYFFDIISLTEEHYINEVNELIVNFDGSIFFKGIDNFVQNVSGVIHDNKTIEIDTEVVIREIIRLRPIN
ncbi:hypothetical protein RJG79_11865 [Mycoplasmatota bacterium WC44]